MKTITSLKDIKAALAALMLELAILSSMLVMAVDISSFNSLLSGQTLQSSRLVNSNANSNEATTIRVLIYNGYDTLPSSVNGIKSC